MEQPKHIYDQTLDSLGIPKLWYASYVSEQVEALIPDNAEVLVYFDLRNTVINEVVLEELVRVLKSYGLINDTDIVAACVMLESSSQKTAYIYKVSRS